MTDRGEMVEELTQGRRVVESHRPVLASATYRCVAEAAGQARRFAAKVLDVFYGTGDERTDNAVLAISEAVANSAEHSDSRFDGHVTIALFDAGGGVVRAEITDDGAATVPTSHQVGNTATSGRGVFLIEALTTRSGHFSAQDGRMTFWFEL
ncbi:ATP-binding protein [Actinomadura scrupuli]|uniref:ATP-binding protein n=1 Tax=Actinomadura scrupuli TaxID=559629 RepID=UPI003D9578AA